MADLMADCYVPENSPRVDSVWLFNSAYDSPLKPTQLISRSYSLMSQHFDIRPVGSPTVDPLSLVPVPWKSYNSLTFPYDTSVN